MPNNLLCHYSEILNSYSINADNLLQSLSIGIIVFTGIIMIGSVSMQNQVFAPDCGGCITQFEKLTRSFGTDAGKIIANLSDLKSLYIFEKLGKYQIEDKE